MTFAVFNCYCAEMHAAEFLEASMPAFVYLSHEHPKSPYIIIKRNAPGHMIDVSTTKK